jgi:glycosyltransferase involved in cell wall biosynthesis
MSPEVTVVAPAFNEARNVYKFHQAVRAALRGIADAAEIVIVDDGSTDSTAERVRELRRQDPLVHVVRLTRNFGSQAAMLAGLRAARGKAIVTMDCDLQHPPEELPRMIAEWRRGARVVQMVRRSNPDATALERATSRLFDWVLRRLTRLPLAPGAGDFRLVDARVAEQLLHFSDVRPFYRGMVSWLGVPVTYLQYDARPRAEGRSGTGLRKRLQLSLDGIAALSIRPLRIAILVGFAAVCLSLAYAGVVLIAFFYGHSVAGYPTIIFTVVFLGAVQLISIGLMGEYIGRIYEQSRGLPPYVVADDDDPEPS